MENFTCTLEKVQSGKRGFYGGVPTAAATVECGNQRLSVAAAKGGNPTAVRFCLFFSVSHCVCTGKNNTLIIKAY